MTVTIPDFTPDQLLRKGFGNLMARTAPAVDLDLDQLYAVVLVKLNASVTPADYPALKTAIEAVVGVQEIDLLVDRKTRATLPPDTKLTANVTVRLNIVDVPPPE